MNYDNISDMNTSTGITICPNCGVGVKALKLKKHLEERCPQKQKVSVPLPETRTISFSSSSENTNRTDLAMPLKILDENYSLKTTLLEVKNSRIDIAVAFASKTENIIEQLLLNGNTVSLLVGTINCFTDPYFIRFCRDMSRKSNSKLNFCVDFRYNESIHWKLYLVEPEITIIGSSNLTSLGISMARDTVVTIDNVNLYLSYLAKINQIKKAHVEDILNTVNNRFDVKLAEYELTHRKARAISQMGSVTPKPNNLGQIKIPDYVDWAVKDESQILPLFIADAVLTKKDLDLFDKKIRPNLQSKESSIGEIQVVAAYNGELSKKEYHDNEIVLMIEYPEIQAFFVLVQIVTYAYEKWWLCNFTSTTFTEPFVITPEIMRVIQLKCSTWRDMSKTFLNSGELHQLATNLKAKPLILTSSKRKITLESCYFGQRVHHATFGEGTVTDIDSHRNDDPVVTVKFDTVGRKRLSLKLACLRPVTTKH